ncbi:transposase [Bradyrhizobium sp. NP1]|uniref:transposase n=1 Tax=Bradyrhizobium sp. NP1 TaxID=3049772 RepID=UPI0025A55133|nr:transposase [Bradyrhizobium sp. NP1]WJR79185.1 transposase [Bradyrhizobium sp. NP1]
MRLKIGAALRVLPGKWIESRRRHHEICGRSFKSWLNGIVRGLRGQTFDQPAHQIVFQDYLEAVWTTQERRDQLVGRISTMAADWTTGPLVEALRGLRGLDLISAATFVAAIGDLARFESARHLMAYLGLVPSEQSSGERIRRGGITKTGNSEARRMLIEVAWSYRYPPREFAQAAIKGTGTDMAENRPGGGASFRIRLPLEGIVG